MSFRDLFKSEKQLIACIHLLPLPGSPNYDGNMDKVYERALAETEIFKLYQVDGLIVENFRDNPFYPGKLPAETITALSSVTREIVNAFPGPVGVNALRNDAPGAMAVAAAAGARFIRVNIHTGAAVTDQGIVEGNAHETLRLRKNLNANVLIFADVNVKHASPLGTRSIQLETKDITERGLADAVIVTGDLTGDAVDTEEVRLVKQNTHVPVLIGSGTTPDNLKHLYLLADGFIVGSYFKKGGLAKNYVEAERVKKLIDFFRSL